MGIIALIIEVDEDDMSLVEARDMLAVIEDIVAKQHPIYDQRVELDGEEQ